MLEILSGIIVVLLIMRLIQAHYQHQQVIKHFNAFATMVGDLADKE